MKQITISLFLTLFLFAGLSIKLDAQPNIGVGAKPVKGAKVYLDGSKKKLH